MGWGESRFNCWGIRGTKLMLFLLYVNVSGMCPQSRLSSQSLKNRLPGFLLRVGWSIPAVPLWMTVSCFLAGNRKA